MSESQTPPIFISRRGQQFGPYSLAETRDYLRSGNILHTDQARFDGSEDWLTIAEVTGIAPPPPKPVPPPPLENFSIGGAPRGTKARHPFLPKAHPLTTLWLAFAITSGVGAILFGLGTIFAGISEFDSLRYRTQEKLAMVGGTGVILGSLALLAGFILFIILLHKFWSAIQDRNATLTPGKAVGLMFVPLFNFYWQFVAILGLAKDMNRYTGVVAPNAKPINESLAITLCVLGCLVWLPWIGWLANLGYFAVAILLWKAFTENTIEILEAKERGSV